VVFPIFEVQSDRIGFGFLQGVVCGFCRFLLRLLIPTC
jgi:hypothetical protein